MPIDRVLSHIAESEQILLKKSRDDKYDVLAVMLLGEDGDVARRIQTDSSGSLKTTSDNASLALEYTDGDLTKITKTIGSTSYEKTLTYTDGNLTGVSAWSEV